MRKKKRNQINHAFEKYVTAYNQLLELSRDYDGSPIYTQTITAKDAEATRLLLELKALCSSNEEIIYLQNLMESLSK